MLCGATLQRSVPATLALSNYHQQAYGLSPSPYSQLLGLMATLKIAESQFNIDEDDVFLENGRLSYENPNYHMDPSRIDDAINSNGNCIYEDIYQELNDICNIGHPIKENHSGTRSNKTFHNLKMGMDIVSSADNHHQPQFDNKRLTDKDVKTKVNEEKVAHVPGQLNNDLYAVPMRRKCSINARSDIETIDLAVDDGEEDVVLGVIDSEKSSPENDVSEENSKKDPQLPNGWEKHEDNDGPYYWHIKSGTIQREPPQLFSKYDSSASLTSSSKSLARDTSAADLLLTFENALNSVVTRSSTSSALDLEADVERKRRHNDAAWKRRSFPSKMVVDESSILSASSIGGSTRCCYSSERPPIRFAVRSLGWVEIAEDDLTPERSSKAVNKCIVDLSVGKNDLLDVVGRWGDGKDLFMDLDEGALKLIDPENFTVLNTQPIHTIRVWGVGRDNGRDFAYVARDRTTRRHMCHVFRCDMPARTIANTLRDICKKIMIERSLQQNLAKPVDIFNGNGSRSMTANVNLLNNNVNVNNGNAGVSTGNVSGSGVNTTMATRPTNLPTEHRRWSRTTPLLINQSFPTPMEEPKKILRAQYLGSTLVSQATGIDTLNEAIDRLSANVPQEQWQVVNVAVAPSMISIQHPQQEDRLIAECRVRYLSFLGIGKLIKHCAFIMHTAQDTFVAHVFYCEPSSGALCKTIEAACKLRYQKCLDAHPQGGTDRQIFSNTNSLQTPGKSIGAAIKSIVGSLTGRKTKSLDS